MKDSIKVRDEFTSTVKKLLFGPNPLEYFCQDNGEEKLFNDPPLEVYITGILFPQNEERLRGINSFQLEETGCEEDADIDEPEEYEELPDKNEAEDIIDSETSKINAKFQSAMGVTLCVKEKSGLIISISAGTYHPEKSKFPLRATVVDGERKIEKSDYEKDCYFRNQHDYRLVVSEAEMPTERKIHKVFQIKDNAGNNVKLQISVTYRMTLENGQGKIFTVTLINSNFDEYADHSLNYKKCWFQVGFSVESSGKFLPLPRNFDMRSEDEDYRLNALLYRDVRDYAIGHGCAATWNGENPKVINAEFMPEYEVKPIVPTSLPGVKLDMKLYYKDRDAAIVDLNKLAEEYSKWIDKETNEVATIPEEHRAVADRQIELCGQCLNRIKKGITLLQKDDQIWQAFAFANKAMLMQQLHYRLPLVKYSDYDSRNFNGILEKSITLPDVEDENTWFGKDKFTYGKWRPFQIAFLVMNLCSMSDLKSDERKIVDLIWFPTGGGKTEAYLGLTAFSIFLRKLRDKKDRGTSVIMRYTLRLLTSQQYERAASLICAMEKIRSENQDILGEERITIGLWVGSSLTPNKQKEAADNIKRIKNQKKEENASIILKCPWCGASMQTYIDKSDNIRTPGYVEGNDEVHFQCDNPNCDFHEDDFELPLKLYDDDIYANPPTLLFGTVDKFAMLPFKPKAKSLFGGDNDNAAPDLIIQDELHLITGPLGSAVGIYEVLIEELCKSNGAKPKIIASTATISHARQQCNALYGCGEGNVFQFPVQGTSYRDSFFAHEEDCSIEDSSAIGRKYIGLYGASASTSASASIATFAALMYAAKAIDVDNEAERDPYWTNLAYFGSMRELGQAATWYITDIKERLETIYKWRMEASLDRTKRRYIFGSGQAELTSRVSNDDITKILKKLEESYSGCMETPSDESPEKREHPLDICLATNMISVGVDVPRLGLMTVTGQPKSISEYIQATSRVGRDAKRAPGVVYVIYNTSKSRDKSYYEKFQSQHEKLYYNVEPTSVTPFSKPMRERALPAILAAIHRLIYSSAGKRAKANYIPSDAEVEEIVEMFTERVEGIDPDEKEATKRQLMNCIKLWKFWKPEKYSYDNVYAFGNPPPLLVPAGTIRPNDWKEIGWDAPTSMRNVDGTCGLDTTKTIVKQD